MDRPDYPRRFRIGRGRDRMIVTARPTGEFLFTFEEGFSDDSIDSSITSQFALGSLVGARPGAVAGVDPSLVPLPSEPSPADALIQRLRSRSMRVVTMPSARAMRAGVRDFLKDVPGSRAAAPIYQPVSDLSPSAAMAPIPSTLLVSLRDADDATAIGRIEALGTRCDPDWPDSAGALRRFTLAAGISDDGFDLLPRIRTVPGVDFAELDWMSLDPLEQAPVAEQWSLQRIGVEAAWQKTKGEGVLIAVIDTGFDLEHPALEEAFKGSGTGDDVQAPLERSIGPPEEDWHWHGTAVAGVVAGSLAPSRAAGVAPGCKLLGLRVDPISDSNIAQALLHAKEANAKVVNLSLRSSGPQSSLQIAIREAWKAGMVIVASAGNAGPEDRPKVVYPAAYPEVIAVGASDDAEDPGYQGPKKAQAGDDEQWFSHYGPQLSVLAPGIRIRTADVRGEAGYNQGPPEPPEGSAEPPKGGSALTWFNYRYSGEEAGDASGDYQYVFTGTSAAAPHVSGLAGLLLSRDPGLSNRRVREIIESTAEKIGAPGLYPFTTRGKTRSVERGYGRIDAAAALAQLD
jgi:subtilisin family serine protease